MSESNLWESPSVAVLQSNSPLPLEEGLTLVKHRTSSKKTRAIGPESALVLALADVLIDIADPFTVAKFQKAAIVRDVPLKHQRMILGTLTAGLTGEDEDDHARDRKEIRVAAPAAAPAFLRKQEAFLAAVQSVREEDANKTRLKAQKDFERLEAGKAGENRERASTGSVITAANAELDDEGNAFVQEVWNNMQKAADTVTDRFSSEDPLFFQEVTVQGDRVLMFTTGKWQTREGSVMNWNGKDDAGNMAHRSTDLVRKGVSPLMISVEGFHKVEIFLRALRYVEGKKYTFWVNDSLAKKDVAKYELTLHPSGPGLKRLF